MHRILLGAVCAVVATACVAPKAGSVDFEGEDVTDEVEATRSEPSRMASASDGGDPTLHLSPNEVQVLVDPPANMALGAGTFVPYWEALDAHDELHSGHLWIVNRAIDLLADYGDERASKAALRMQSPACLVAWQQGLLDADYLGEYNGGWRDLEPGDGTLEITLSGASWLGHFFDPDTGKNYKGGDDTAYPRAQRYLNDALELWSCDGTSRCAGKRAAFRFAGTDFEKGCYALGLSLHFVTDMSQPMHTALFTALDYPAKQHSHLEEYAMTIQDRYALSDWSPAHASVPQVLMDGARASKALWPSMKASLVQAYEGNGCWAMRRYWVDHNECWEDDPGVDDAIGAALVLGQQMASDFLYALPL